jgi:hypothetical protein
MTVFPKYSPIQLIAFSVCPISKAPRIDPARTAPHVAKAMSAGLLSASDVRRRDYVASDANVALLIRLPEREDYVAFLNAFTTRT